MHRDREEEYGRYARRSGRMEYANKENDYRYPYSKYYDEYERPGRNVRKRKNYCTRPWWY